MLVYFGLRNKQNKKKSNSSLTNEYSWKNVFEAEHVSPYDRRRDGLGAWTPTFYRFIQDVQLAT